MPFIPAPLTAQVEVNARLDSLPVQNVFRFQNDNGISQANLDVLVSNVASWVIDQYAPAQSNQLVFQATYAFDISAQISVEATDTSTTGITGSQVVESEPNNVSKFVMWETGFRGRSAKGGFHWLSIPTDQITQNTISNSYATTMTAVAGSLIGLGAMGPGWQLVVASFQFNNAPRTTAALFTVNGVVLPNNRVGSMAGRMH